MNSGEKLKWNGLRAVENNNRSWVEEMREYVQILSWTDQLAGLIGGVSADDVRKHSQETERYPDHPNAYGAIFKGSGWELIGYRKSLWPGNHARRIGIWKWTDNKKPAETRVKAGSLFASPD